MKYIERGHKVDENVAREIINHKSLRHPNIIRFKEVVLTPTHLAIVMEYAVGGELFERICNAGRCNEDEARYFFQQLISGVSYCHFLQICHRHLKLENMLLDGSPAPRLKICDFGYRSHLFCTRGQNRRWGRRRISHRRCFLGENMTGSSKLEGRSPSCRLSDKASDLLQRWFEDDDVLERALSGEILHAELPGMSVELPFPQILVTTAGPQSSHIFQIFRLQDGRKSSFWMEMDCDA